MTTDAQHDNVPGYFADFVKANAGEHAALGREIAGIRGALWVLTGIAAVVGAPLLVAVSNYLLGW